MSHPAPGVHPLSCPGCASELVGLEFDVLFACRSCRRLIDPASRRSHPLEVALLPVPEQHVLWLPFWVFPVRLSVSGKGAPAGLARRVAERTSRVYVAAFLLDREELYGEPGLIWTRRQDQVPRRPFAAGEGVAVAGVRRDAQVAERYVLPYLSQICDEQADITGLELEVQVGREAVPLAVPYLDEGAALLDGLSGLRYPAAAFEDLAGLRRIHASMSGSL